MKIHTNAIAAAKDWTTWVALTVAGSLGGIAVLLPEPWNMRGQVAAAVLALVGTILKGPPPKEPTP